jgi:hypothetical protein
MVASLDQAQLDLQPYIDRLRRCVEDAIKTFLADQAAHLHLMRVGTQANVLRDYIVANIRAEFPEDEAGVSHSTRNQLFLLNIQNRYFLRFKKLDRRLRTRNIPTQLSLDYLLQRPLVLFPTLEPATHLNVGYQPGMTLASSSFWITCPDGDVLDWKLSLTEPVEPTPLRVLSPTPKPKPSGARVRPKGIPGAAEANDEPG